MDFFHYQNNVLYAEDVAVPEIIAQWGTPCYIYSRATLERHWRVFDNALHQHPHLVCYSVKACSNIAVLDILARLGSGFDVVSGGELARVLAAGGAASKTAFSGVGKTAAEIEYALAAEILCFNVESLPELQRINAIAGSMGKVAPITIRVNPDVDAQTHPYIATGLKENKFGIAYHEARQAYELAASLPNLQIVGLAYHIGSQIVELDPFLAAVDRMLLLEQELKAAGFTMQHLDVGGGIGVRYQAENPPTPQNFVEALSQRISDKELNIIVAPGRAIAANAGILVAKVEYLKKNDYKNFAIVDAAMNDLIRPALYDAWHDIIPVTRTERIPVEEYDVVGPVCETGDILGKKRPLRVEPGDLLAIRTAGAYGFCMSSNYNSRPRAAEILVDGTNAYLIRARESVTDLFASEKMLAASTVS